MAELPNAAHTVIDGNVIKALRYVSGSMAVEASPDAYFETCQELMPEAMNDAVQQLTHHAFPSLLAEYPDVLARAAMHGFAVGNMFAVSAIGQANNIPLFNEILTGDLRALDQGLHSPTGTTVFDLEAILRKAGAEHAKTLRKHVPWYVFEPHLRTDTDHPERAVKPNLIYQNSLGYVAGAATVFLASRVYRQHQSRDMAAEYEIHHTAQALVRRQVLNYDDIIEELTTEN